mmetsp:Transcript_5058/g.15397  ORF Transcript_5058/g.15397 Transcript_5058/m.15397 type:complete len:610 (-) Transcript_5058:263-2092(-)
MYTSSSRLFNKARPYPAWRLVSAAVLENAGQDLLEVFCTPIRSLARLDADYVTSRPMCPRTREDAIVADASTLKSFSLSLAPPKAAARSRTCRPSAISPDLATACDDADAGSLNHDVAGDDAATDSTVAAATSVLGDGSITQTPTPNIFGGNTDSQTFGVNFDTSPPAAPSSAISLEAGFGALADFGSGDFHSGNFDTDDFGGGDFGASTIFDSSTTIGANNQLNANGSNVAAGTAFGVSDSFDAEFGVQSSPSQSSAVSGATSSLSMLDASSTSSLITTPFFDMPEASRTANIDPSPFHDAFGGEWTSSSNFADVNGVAGDDNSPFSSGNGGVPTMDRAAEVDRMTYPRRESRVCPTRIGGHRLLVSEIVDATLEGRKLVQYKVSGELRLLPLSANSDASEFRFRLKNAHRIEQVKVNDKYVKASEGTYTVQLPAISGAKALPLMKYISTSRWRPVPLFVDATATPKGIGDVDLDISVETNPQLKTPLVNVSIAMPIPLEAGDLYSCSEIQPAGQWDASKRCATWHLPNLLTPRGSPFRCSAVLGNTHDAPVVAAAATSPLDVSFSCEGVTISGIELEVQLGPTSGSIDKLLRKFASGKYLVTPLLMQ